ncbi:MAG: F0F1 ATP synthase subunit epsilon [Bacteroidales bacterium]|jgi:F-type H+-transporting ATPase subunit epsilon|nr:F0F1 ATP synthase subunit epsilon [Bacteroidales bacterium]
MKVEIITPDATLFSGENVTLVQLPGIDGSFEVLNHHAPLISVLDKGKIKILNTGEKEPLFFDIKGGVIEVLKNKVLILAE